jgi:DNA-binding MarR family transcriptional regulator
MTKDQQLDTIYFFLLERTVRRIRKFVQREFAKRGHDISGEQWVVLKRLYEMPGISQTDIADSTFKDPASVTRMLDLLELRGFIERRAVQGDRRSTAVHLTEKGGNFVNEVIPLAVEMRKFGMRGVSDEDKEVFLKVLDQVYENLE